MAQIFGATVAVPATSPTWGNPNVRVTSRHLMQEAGRRSCRSRAASQDAASDDVGLQSAVRVHEERFCSTTVARLPSVSLLRLDALLHPAAAVDGDDAGVATRCSAKLT